jgi:hypothetical protein
MVHSRRNAAGLSHHGERLPPILLTSREVIWGPAFGRSASVHRPFQGGGSLPRGTRWTVQCIEPRTHRGPCVHRFHSQLPFFVPSVILQSPLYWQVSYQLANDSDRGYLHRSYQCAFTNVRLAANLFRSERHGVTAPQRHAASRPESAT